MYIMIALANQNQRKNLVIFMIFFWNGKAFKDVFFIKFFYVCSF